MASTTHCCPSLRTNFWRTRALRYFRGSWTYQQTHALESVDPVPCPYIQMKMETFIIIFQENECWLLWKNAVSMEDVEWKCEGCREGVAEYGIEFVSYPVLSLFLPHWMAGCWQRVSGCGLPEQLGASDAVADWTCKDDAGCPQVYQSEPIRALAAARKGVAVHVQRARVVERLMSQGDLVEFFYQGLAASLRLNVFWVAVSLSWLLDE